MRGRIFGMLLGLVLLSGAVSVLDADCYTYYYSSPVSYQGNSWCEGWNSTNCTQCWNDSGGSCSTPLLYCNPGPKHPIA